MTFTGSHRGGGRRVRAVAVKQHGDAQAELRDHVLLHFRKELLPRSHVAAADEDGGSLQVSPREDGPMHEVAHLLRLDAAIGKHLVGAGVDGHDAIEYARVRIGIELNENAALVHRRHSAAEHRLAARLGQAGLHWKTRPSGTGG